MAAGPLPLHWDQVSISIHSKQNQAGRGIQGPNVAVSEKLTTVRSKLANVTALQLVQMTTENLGGLIALGRAVRHIL